MARKVTPESFFAMISDIRRSIPKMAITTDVIAGFPGETNAEFEETLQFLEQVQFSGGHVFTFSPRPGTAAERMPDPVQCQFVRREMPSYGKRWLSLPNSSSNNFLVKWCLCCGNRQMLMENMVGDSMD
jgi:hypothetical protein